MPKFSQFYMAIALILALSFGAQAARTPIGFGLGLDNEELPTNIVITSIMPKSPAERAGLAVGERVVAIEDCAVSNCPIKKIRSLLTLKKGKIITITVADNAGQTRKVIIKHPED